MSLREKFLRLISEYRTVFEEVWKTGIFKNDFGSFVRHDIADELGEIATSYGSIYSSKGSVGQTKWTPVPWLAIFDNRITNKATEGEYIVYLFNSETKDLYLTFNQATAEKNNAAVRNHLKENASKIRSKITLPSKVSLDEINSGNAAYDAGCVCYIKYTADDMPSDENLKEDLLAFLDIYKEYYELFYANQNEWWPSQEEYPLNLTKDDWKKYLFEIELPSHPSPIKMLKGMIELGNEASCKQLSDTYGGHPSVYAGCAMILGRRVKKYFDLPACMDGDQDRYFPFPFVGKYRGGSEDNYIYKIRPELLAALEEIDLSSINPYYEEEHKIGTFDSWEIIDETTAIKTCDKSFFEHKGSGVPKNICWFFDAEDISSGESNEVELLFDGNTYIGKVRNDTTDRRRIQIFWNADLANCLEKHRTPNVTATFKKIDKNKYEIIMNKEGEKEMTIKDQITAIKTYIATKGFNYDGALIENFYLGLKSKPFVILAGTSGTGKTRLVKLFSEAIQAKYLPVPVRPDWSDSSDLFGHKDLNGNFVKGAIIDFIKDAIDEKTTPYILCLDEMNLARVEYYMSDILSVIETREFDENKKITSKPLVSKEYCRSSNGRNEYGELQFPGNLYIVGTVNMDETTFPFSKKVLDRANTIEFSYVDLLSMPSFSAEMAPKVTVDNDFLASKYITLNDCDAADKGYITGVCTTLSRVNGILEMANAHIGYRVRDEIVFYMLNNKKADLLDEKAAFDNQIMQKILPRIQGSSESIKKMLEELLKICDSEKFEASAKKINFMIKRYDEDGFTSYWL